ncbi:MAG: HEAT repeat domain-containing protein [Pseudomonadota bacterium]
MRFLKLYLLTFGVALQIQSSFAANAETEASPKETAEQATQQGVTAKSLPQPGSLHYQQLHEKIAGGQASLAEIRIALTERDPMILSNVMQALYAMRWHRGVLKLLSGLWSIEREKYPELAWEEIGEAPARVALASTISRIKNVKTKTYLEYIRGCVGHEEQLSSSQAIIGLGFNGHPDDLPTLKAHSAGNNVYVAQSAITGLGLFGSLQARDTLIDLLRSFKETNRGALIKDVLKQAYKWPPPPQYNPLPENNNASLN